MIRVYVAAPYEDAPLVRQVHTRLNSVGAEPTSTWAILATGKEDFSRLSPERLADIAAENDNDVRRADVVIVLAREGVGGEMFAEARVALEWRKLVLWLGRRTLSAWRPGVIRCASIDEAIEWVGAHVAVAS